jgi:hypothetical protein
MMLVNPLAIMNRFKKNQVKCFQSRWSILQKFRTYNWGWVQTPLTAEISTVDIVLSSMILRYIQNFRYRDKNSIQAPQDVKLAPDYNRHTHCHHAVIASFPLRRGAADRGVRRPAGDELGTVKGTGEGNVGNAIQSWESLGLRGWSARLFLHYLMACRAGMG